jgi:hypothetical protein
MFDSTEQAISKITELYFADAGSDCLQKTLLAAKTSRSFASDGVLFIGANLPTGHMHAWIIEKNTQPDPVDRHWISYQPLFAIHA